MSEIDYQIETLKLLIKDSLDRVRGSTNDHYCHWQSTKRKQWRKEIKELEAKKK